MVWYQNLYVGRLISPRKDSVIDEIDRGSYPAFVYLLIVSQGSNSQLEIIKATELAHDYVREHCLLIVGLAQGRTEAISLLERLARDVWRDRKNADIRAWLSEEHGQG